ncbi:putative redox protein [Marisediminitalea aggregata]|uniref:Putative redox protein n=1 Tax=Marisediminitalea aggregata TaxID=634436 RepID=A0A1M5Q611_9ALTE|nr:OsmC family protein [Marisediminitalea aggregata]MEC7468332.1 OsmC family protein [Pseudomonadota bacterium]MEC7825210.1 OsmC family protein [Pseudomonadota bacterium]SHH09189.1 putative redox protein [Marisediminitalea aggregata]
MKATVSWQQALTFSGQTESGYQQTMDGNGKAISPMESVLLAVGACSSIDVVDILKKRRLTVHDCECDLTAERAEQPPRVFTAIHAHYKVKGDNLSDKDVDRAVALSAEKYCSVMLMLKGNVNITTSYEIM